MRKGISDRLKWFKKCMLQLYNNTPKYPLLIEYWLDKFILFVV